jgi:hypothetical protein
MATGLVWATAARQLPGIAPRLRPFHFWRPIGAALVVAMLTLMVAPLQAAEMVGKPSTARTAKDDAIRCIPLEKLPIAIRGKVAAVIDDVSLYRRLPVHSVDCEPDIFQYIITNPDVMVNIWHVMGVSNVMLDRIDADHYRCADGDGTTARVEVVYRSPQMQVIYAEGLYDGPLFPRPVRGQCVAILQYTSVHKASGRYEETAQLDTFLHVDNIGVEILAKLFQGFVGRTIDHNFVETVSFIASVSRTAETNPRGMRRMVARLNHVEPERRAQFIAVTDRVPAKLAGVSPGDDDDNEALAEVVQSSAVEKPLPALKK